jgi:tetratricopeptide (TPR) repeat protein
MRTQPILIFLAVATQIVWPLSAHGETADQRFVDGLVERRLFSLAETACRNQLAGSDLSPRQQADWTVELIRVISLHATHSPPSERAAQWQAAHQDAQQFLASNPQHPRRVLVELQDGLAYLAEGEMARLEADVAVEPQEALDRARETIRAAARQLEAIEKQLTEQMAASSGRSRDDDQLSADELFSLQNNVRFQLARAFRNQALCYPSDSSDRVAALDNATKQLNATLTQLQPTDSLTWQVYLDLATCYRLRGELPQAQRTLQTLLSESAPVEAQLGGSAELAHVLIAADRARQAIDEIQRARSQLQQTSPALDFAELEAMLSLWKTSASRKDETMAAQWKEKVAQAVTQIEQLHGAYWGRRAKLGQLSVAGTGLAEGDIDILASSAGEMYKREEFDDAIRTFDRAAELARTAGNVQKASEIEYNSALIEQELQRYEAAARRLRRLAFEDPSHAQSPSKHLLAAFNLAQELRRDASLIDRYQMLLEEHLEQWPSGNTANIARQWLGDSYLSQQRWEEAISAFRAITADAKQFADAMDRLATCWLGWLQQRRREDQPINAILNDATQYFDTIILGPQRQWPERWSPAQLRAVLATARLRLEYAPEDLVDAQRVLEAALPHAPQDDPQWLEEVQSLLVVALAGQPGQQDNALQLLQQLGSGSLDQLLELIKRLSNLSASAPANLRRQIAQVQLAALDQVNASSTDLPAGRQLSIDQARAQALRDAGQLTEALNVYRQLATEQPDSATIQLALAEVLLQSTDEPTLSEAIQQWQKVARRLRPGTNEWLRARYSIALALYRRNRPSRDGKPADRALAAQRLRYLKATTDVDKTSWKTKVDQLLLQCE